MAIDRDIQRILQLYPEDCQPLSVSPFRSPMSFSGAALWRVVAPRGPLCLRRWSPEFPSTERLEFLQAVLWHVNQEGFDRIPVPVETHHKHGYIWHAGHLWELTPWLPGAADYRANPTKPRLHNAMIALAAFHEAARSFPLPETGPIGSPGIADRALRLQALLGGRLVELRKALGAGEYPAIAQRGRRLIDAAMRHGPSVLHALETASGLDVAVQPCIRDVWHAHILFEADEVTGIVDFGALRPDNIATDVARLLGSLAQDDVSDWQAGLAAYQSVRRLSRNEHNLVLAFDRSTVLMGGLQWLEWIYLEGRVFPEEAAVIARLDEFLLRLEHLSQTLA
jgi:homoserine kinase type II